MGPKITVDSATMMNKGLELIEAHHLFALSRTRSTCWCIRNRWCMGWSSFATARWWRSWARPTCASRSPIAWPGRERIDGPAPQLDLAKVRELTFEAPDLVRFPALALARQALRAGGAAPTVLNAANEVAVAEFIAGRLGFRRHRDPGRSDPGAAAGRGLMAEPTGIEAALAIDHVARSLARDLLPEIAAKAS